MKDIFVIQYHKDYLATPQFFKKMWYGYSQPIGNSHPIARDSPFFAGRGVRIE
jgi:hypothetical protein